MQLIAGCFGMTVLALACALVIALFDDGWALRIAAILIARKEARVAYRACYAEELKRREEEFDCPRVPWQSERVEERGL